MRTRLLTIREPGEHYVISFPSYKRLCGGDEVAGKLLEHFDYLTRCVMENEDTDEPQPFSRSIAQIHRDLDGNHGDKQIKQAISYLEGRGFISVSRDPGQTNQITLHVKVINGQSDLGQTTRVQDGPRSNDPGTQVKRPGSDHSYIQTSVDQAKSTPETLPGEDELEPDTDGGNWLFRLSQKHNVTIGANRKGWTSTRKNLDTALDSRNPNSLSRRCELRYLVTANRGGDITEAVAKKADGFANRGWQSDFQPSREIQSNTPGPRVKFPRPATSQEKAIAALDSWKEEFLAEEE